MATQTASIEVSSFTNDLSAEVRTITWETLAGSDVGSAVKLPSFSDKTVHAFGTFDTGTCTLQGSNDPLAGTDPGSASWISLVDPQGNAIAFTAAGIETILENPIWIRPSVSGGGGSCDIDVIISVKR